MGHALGYLDHSTNSADVMYPYICGVNFITEAEKKHLEQGYSFFYP